jgi:hypothetical protein
LSVSCTDIVINKFQYFSVSRTRHLFFFLSHTVLFFFAFQETKTDKLLKKKKKKKKKCVTLPSTIHERDKVPENTIVSAEQGQPPSVSVGKSYRKKIQTSLPCNTRGVGCHFSPLHSV